MTNTKRVPIPRDLRPYLTEIARRLYSKRAAVMIGSGFSKNAKARDNSVKHFPSWAELGDTLFKKLNNRMPEAKDRYLSVPTLAQEIEAGIGRPALNDILIGAIPDLDHEPSTLHVNILELPWTDVFTTNYDTLLERACRSVTSRKYETIVDQHELVYSGRPRIIKLHGTLSPPVSLTLTDEDYRRYPIDHAAFVNTVRQALIENTLCLIGFSATDPNFLRWLGWIHDNLGQQHSPKIYLIGTSDLTTTQAELLRQRNIIAIDMSKYSDLSSKDHQNILRRFIEVLHQHKEKHTRLIWPDAVSHQTPEPAIGKQSPRQLIKEWSRERNSFPNWVVTPSDRRHQLWLRTRDWINNKKSIDAVPKSLELEYFFELNWRMEQCFYPISESMLQLFEDLIRRYEPKSDIQDSRINPNQTDQTHIDQAAVNVSTRSMWLSISLSVLRKYREVGKMNQWRILYNSMDQHSKFMSRTDLAQLHFENCLSALFDFDFPLLNARLNGWPIDQTLPLWEARRATLLAELGRLSDANRILTDALSTIRFNLNLRPITTDYSMISQEGIVMFLLDLV